MLLGLMVRCLLFDRGENMESVCSCVGLNSSPHILTVNITSHTHCYRHVEKINQSCPPALTPRLVTMAISFDQHCKYTLHK